MYCGGIYKILITAISLLLIIGCGGINKGGELVWPLPPDEPKIRYVGTLSTARDVEMDSIGKALKTAVFGGEAVEGDGKPYGVYGIRMAGFMLQIQAWERCSFLILKLKNLQCSAEKGAVYYQNQQV